MRSIRARRKSIRIFGSITILNGVAAWSGLARLRLLKLFLSAATIWKSRFLSMSILFYNRSAKTFRAKFLAEDRRLACHGRRASGLSGSRDGRRPRQPKDGRLPQKKIGMIKMATMFTTLIIGLIAGPAV